MKKRKGDTWNLNHLNDLVFRKLQNGLREDIFRIKQKPIYQIPKEGFKEEGDTPENREKRECLDGKNPSLHMRFNEDIRTLCTKYGLPIPATSIIKKYLYFGVRSDYLTEDPIASFSTITEDLYSYTKNPIGLQAWDNSGVPYSLVVIPANATLAEGQRFLKDNWKNFQERWRLQGWQCQPNGWRTIQKKEIIENVISLYESLVHKKRKKGYLEEEISKLLKERGIYWSEANIHKTIQQYKTKKQKKKYV